MKLKSIVVGVPRRVAMAGLAPLERELLRRAEPAGVCPIFIIGPPRSGTTLFYELLVTRYRFAYFSNLAHRLYRTPVAATLLGQRLIERRRERFQSHYGVIKGWGSPNEGGWIWRRWLPEDHHLDKADLEDRPVDCMRRTVAATAEEMGAPFVSKNVLHSVQMRLLDRVFSGCVFLEVRREPDDNIRSIVRIYQERLESGEDACWVSVKPRGWREHQNSDPVEKATAQVFGVRRDVEDGAHAVGSHRRHTISYESLCRDPVGVLDETGSFLHSSGITVNERRPIPSEFPPSRGRPLDPESERRIEHLVQQFERRVPGSAPDSLNLASEVTQPCSK